MLDVDRPWTHGAQRETPDKGWLPEAPPHPCRSNVPRSLVPAHQQLHSSTGPPACHLPWLQTPTYQMSKLWHTAAWKELGSQPRLMSVTIMLHCPPWTPASRKPYLIHSPPTRIRGQLWAVLQSPADSDDSITAERMGSRGGTARRVGVVGIPGACSVALAQESCDQVLPATPTSTSPPTWGSHVNTWDGEVRGRTSCFRPVAHLLFRAASLWSVGCGGRQAPLVGGQVLLGQPQSRPRPHLGD